MNGNVIWDAVGSHRAWQPGRDPSTWLQFFRVDPQSHFLARPAPDLDGDGTGDLVWAFSSAPSIFALSGADGSLLWTYRAEPDGPGGPSPETPEPTEPVERLARRGHVLGAPELADLDRDGTPDLIVTVKFAESPEEQERRSAEEDRRGLAQDQRPPALRRVIAVSGRSGRWLWSSPVDRSFTSFEESSWNRPETIVRGRASAMVAILSGSQWLGLDPATGRPIAGPIDLGFVPVRPVQDADLDGDGTPEILALGPGPATGQQVLSAFSTGTGFKPWTVTVNAKYEKIDDVFLIHDLPDEIRSPPNWPLVADLDGDGRSEVFVPDAGPMPPGAGYRGLRALDGPTGRTRWVRPMRPRTTANDGREELLDAPDLDGDGTRDLVAVSQFDGRDAPAPARSEPSAPRRIYVDAISGKDGRPLWFWSMDLPELAFAGIQAPRWWGRGPDGWPLLAVTIGSRPLSVFPMSLILPPIVHNLEASTGREVHALEGLTRTDVADVDGDGLADLWGEVNGELQAYRGEPPEIWRALGRFASAVQQSEETVRILREPADFDGDGIGDARIVGLRQLGPWRASRRGVAPQSSARAATAACSGRRGSGHRNAGTSGMPGNIIPWRASRCPPATSMAMARRTWSSGGIDTAAGRAGVPQPSRWTSSRAARVAISARPAPCTWDSTRGASRMSFGSRPTSSSRRPGRTSWCDTSTPSPGL